MSDGTGKSICAGAPKGTAPQLDSPNAPACRSLAASTFFVPRDISDFIAFAGSGFVPSAGDLEALALATRVSDSGPSGPPWGLVMALSASVGYIFTCHRVWRCALCFFVGTCPGSPLDSAAGVCLPLVLLPVAAGGWVSQAPTASSEDSLDLATAACSLLNRWLRYRSRCSS